MLRFVIKQNFILTFFGSARISQLISFNLLGSFKCNIANPAILTQKI